jgi:hypothetical protein
MKRLLHNNFECYFGRFLWRAVRLLLPQVCESWKAMKREPVSWLYNWTTLPPEEINTGTWFTGFAVGDEDHVLPLKKKSKSIPVRGRGGL